MTDEQISNVWRQFCLPVYNKNPRHRLYAITPESKRQLVALYRACRDSSDNNDGQAQELFAWALEQFTDCGVNVLQPPRPAELKAPEMERDPLGNVLPNPFLTKDLQGQTILRQRNPRLAEHCERIAKSPWKAWADWQDEQASNLKQRVTKYDADAHAANPYVRGFTNETERGRFEKEHADLVETCRREAVPVSFPTGKDFNLTIQSRIAKTPKLAALAAGMRRHEQQFISEARAKAKAEIEAARKNLESLEAAAK